MALNKTAFQSGDEGVPSLAVDGIHSSDSGGCAKTAWSEKPWWSVNLGQEYLIDGVALTTSNALCEYNNSKDADNSDVC